MIRALIVDDEKITRKGMISVVPWDRFGIEIVGDVGSAEAALAFLEGQAVELAFIDVAMPGMNGIELMREMRSRGFGCAVVVLSFHDDFQYVQEALRMGAVDYVLKTQLDDEKIVEMLERVARHIRGDAAGLEELCCLVPLKDPEAARRALGELPPASRETAVLGGSVVMVRMREPVAEAAAAAWRCGAALVVLGGAAGAESRELLGRVEAALSRRAFYECGGETRPCRMDAGALARDRAECPAEELDSLRGQWSSLAWLLEDRQYRDLVERTRSLQPGVADLTAVLSEARSDFVRAFPFLAGEPGWESAGAECWSWAKWQSLLERARDALKRRIAGQRYSEEVARKVIAAVEVINRTAGRYLKEEAAAAQVGLSRSYFSQCFKDITGVEFKRYLAEKSVAEAGQLLARSDLSFRTISSRLGYQNESHFGRVFRAATGLSPKEFRARSRSRREPGS